MNWQKKVDSHKSLLSLFSLPSLHKQGLLIRYRELHSGSQKYSTVVVTEPELEVYDVGSLSKFTKYEFFISPFYRTVEGMPSNSKIVQTLEDGEYSISFYFVSLNMKTEFLCYFNPHSATEEESIPTHPFAIFHSPEHPLC